MVKTGGNAKGHTRKRRPHSGSFSVTTNHDLRSRRIRQKKRGKVMRMAVLPPTDSAEEAENLMSVSGPPPPAETRRHPHAPSRRVRPRPLGGASPCGDHVWIDNFSNTGPQGPGNCSYPEHPGQYWDPLAVSIGQHGLCRHVMAHR